MELVCETYFDFDEGWHTQTRGQYKQNKPLHSASNVTELAGKSPYWFMSRLE